MTERSGRMQVLDSIGRYVDDCFCRDDFGTYGSRYSSKTASSELCDRLPPDAAGFIHGLCDTTASALGDWPDSRPPFPGSNWILQNVGLPTVPKNRTSREVLFERAVAARSKNVAAEDETLWNQLAVASGYTNEVRGSRAAVDLIVKTAASSYDLIELKLPSERGSEYPLHAAIEILKYGMVFIAARQHVTMQGVQLSDAQRLLAASSLRLCVLAPTYFYEGFKMQPLEEFINEGLGRFPRLSRLGLKMQFQFQEMSLPDDLPASDVSVPMATDAFKARRPVYR